MYRQGTSQATHFRLRPLRRQDSCRHSSRHQGSAADRACRCVQSQDRVPAHNAHIGFQCSSRFAARRTHHVRPLRACGLQGMAASRRESRDHLSFPHRAMCRSQARLHRQRSAYAHRHPLLEATNAAHRLQGTDARPH